MKRQDVISILITFVVGFFAGAYLYLGHFAILVTPDPVATAERQEQLIIVSESYGACGQACPSFRVAFDGTYRWRYFETIGGPVAFKDGVLPLDIQRDLKRQVIAADLQQQAEPITPSECRSDNDGIDVRYQVTLNSLIYELDSCGTNINRDSLLWQSLARVWSYLQTTP